ncbi:MAG TPA: HEAT repeat domain-containing protein [Nostocaceae cyanobacterium]|nr:HEAT repeat domain-containing protein [Nostocaceae cyanobacterium]
MEKKRNVDTVKASEQGLNKLRDAKNKEKLTYEKIAKNIHVEPKTVQRFFNGEYIQRTTAIEIVEILGLKLEDIIESKPQIPPETTPASTINWAEICRERLPKRITSNYLMQDEEAKKEREQIYVPLALVQRKKIEKRDKRHFAPQAGTELDEPQYEPEQKFAHQDFLTQILERGEGKTKGRQIALIGEPGAGKTTLLQYIALWILENNLGLPIWVSLADLGRNDQEINLHDYIFKIWLKQAISHTEITPKIQADLHQQIEQGRVWLLLDGADEMSIGSQFHQPLETIARQLEGWIGRFSRVVLTCRLNVWQADVNALEAFETYRLLDFDYPQQVHEFIDKYFSDKGEEGKQKSARLKRELDVTERGRLQNLIQNPLRLTLLCSIWQREEEKLPETKAGLYQQFVNYIYNWKKNRFPTTKKQQRELNHGLGKLALRDIDAGGSRFRLREDFIGAELGDADDENSLFYLALKVGWLNHVGIAAESPSQKVYAFYHASFEEYFAALEIKDWQDFFKHIPENPHQGTYRIFLPQWKEVILLWLGREDIELEKKEEFIQALCNFQDDCGQFYQYRAFFLAAAGIGEFKECKLSDEIVDQLLRYGFGYFDQKKQKWLNFTYKIAKAARLVIRETNTKKAISPLINLINVSDDEYNKIMAAKILGNIYDANEDAINTLFDLIQNSHDENIMYLAMITLGEIDAVNQEVINNFVDLINFNDDNSTQRGAARILGDIGNGNQEAIQALVDLINISDDKDTKLIATQALGKIGNGNQLAIQSLVNLINIYNDKDIRIPAAMYLGDIGNGNQEAIQVLVDLINISDNDDTKYWAIISLAKIGNKNQEAIQSLVNLVNISEHQHNKIMAAMCLGEIGNKNQETINILVNLISTSDNNSDKILVAESLGKIDNENQEAIKTLIDLIRLSDDVFTKIRAAESLGKIDNENQEAIKTLIDLINSYNDKDIKYWAAECLGKIYDKNQEAIKALIDLISYDNEYISKRAAECLEEITETKQMTIVIANLQKYLPNEVYDNNSEFNSKCYSLFWHFANNLSYPDFYAAWQQGKVSS